MIEVIKPGLFTSVQDLGRTGWQAQGISVGGVLDTVALRIANAILGNSENAAGLECTARGPILRFHANARVALVGAAVEGVAMRRAFDVSAGTELGLERVANGGRFYVAIAGGIAVQPVLGSASTHLAGGFGGYDGRLLRAGDRLKLAAIPGTTCAAKSSWSVSSALVPEGGDVVRVRALEGPQYEWFAADIQQRFWESAYEVTAQSDRMGLRLRGPVLPLLIEREMISEPVAFGSVQVPPSGEPIVLLADRQTLGGYPKIASVISADIPKLARIRAGLALHFEPVSLEEAQHHRHVLEQALATLRAGLGEKNGPPTDA